MGIIIQKSLWYQIEHFHSRLNQKRLFNEAPFYLSKFASLIVGIYIFWYWKNKRKILLLRDIFYWSFSLLVSECVCSSDSVVEGGGERAAIGIYHTRRFIFYFTIFFVRSESRAAKKNDRNALGHVQRSRRQRFSNSHAFFSSLSEI